MENTNQFLQGIESGCALANVCIRIAQLIEHHESNHDYAIATDTLRCVITAALEEPWPVTGDFEEFMKKFNF